MHEPVVIWARHLVLTILATLPIGYGSVLFGFYNRSIFLDVSEVVRSAFYNIPALLVVGLPVGVGFATLTLFTYYGSHLQERARLAILVLAMAMSLAAFVLANEVVPQANRGIPLVFELYRTPGLLFENSRGKRRPEMTTVELAATIRDLKERGLNARSYELTYHLRFALPALTFSWCLFGMSVGYLLSLTFASSSYVFCAGFSMAIMSGVCGSTYAFWTAARPPLGLAAFWVAWLPSLVSLIVAGLAYLFYFFEEELAT